MNALVSTVLTKYSEWDRYAEKFGFVTIARSTFRALLDATDDESGERVSRAMGSQNPREMTLFWFGKLGLDAFLDYLSLIRKYGKWIELEVHRDERNVTIHILQEFGPRYSTFTAAFMDEAVREVVGVVPTVQVGRNSVVLRFVPPPASM